MFTPQSLNIALLMMITSAVCWGSWANTFKGVKNYRFELFYWDYAVGIFLISLILGHTMGSTGHDASSLIHNIHSAGVSNVVNALIGGALFNLANLLLVAAIDMAGLAVAFPVSIGIALVVGVVLSYALQPRGNALFLALGVACAFVAVVLDGKAYGSLAAAGRAVSRKSIVVCVISGILMGLWAPFMTHAMTRGQTLGPYSAAIFLTSVGPYRRFHLGHRDGFQSCRRQLHRRCHLLRHRTISSHGRSAMGNFRLEGIRQLRCARQSFPHAHVRVLRVSDFSDRPRQRVIDHQLIGLSS